MISGPNSNTHSTMSRSEQLRYEQLIKENHELKRQIETRERKIYDCRRTLEKRLGSSTVAPANSRQKLLSQSITTIDKSNHTCTETLVTSNTHVSPNGASSNNNIAAKASNNNVSVSEEQPTQSTIFTTTALIETQTHASNEAGK